MKEDIEMDYLVHTAKAANSKFADDESLILSGDGADDSSRPPISAENFKS